MTDPVYVGALDQGTAGTRFLIFDGDGTPVSGAYTDHQRQTGSDGRAEYDPLRLWGCATDAIRRGLVESSVTPAQLRAVGVASQRQTVLLWAADSGEPITNALSWQDRRTADRIADLDADERALVRRRTGLEPDAYFAASKASWLLDHGGEDLRERARDGDVLLGTLDAWLVYNLTGRHATDVTNAAQTMLFDIYDRRWDPDLLSLFDVPRAALPTVHPSSDPAGFGTTDPDGILGTAVPVAGVMGDQQAALLGRVPTEAGTAKVTYGTGNFFIENTGTEPVTAEGELLTTIWFQEAGDDPLYGLEGPVFATGTVLEWLESAGLVEDTSRLGELAAAEDATGPVHLVPGSGGLGAPDWTPGVRTAVFGLSRETTELDHLAAAVEAIAFSTRAVVEAAERATGRDHTTLLVDGGAVQDDAFLRLQADLLGRSLVRAEVTQTTALGAAMAAGLATGVWDSLGDLAHLRPTGERFTPRTESGRFDDAYARWRGLVETVGGLHGHDDRA